MPWYIDVLFVLLIIAYITLVYDGLIQNFYKLEVEPETIFLLALFASILLGYLGSIYLLYFICYNEFETEKVNPSDLRSGDHIFVPGSMSIGSKMKGVVGYYHHGVYLGETDGKNMVTDFGVVNKSRPVTRELDEFVKGYSNQLYRRKYKVESRMLTPERTLEYAKFICSGGCPWQPYRVGANNCEHYASLLKMRQLFSSQVPSFQICFLLHLLLFMHFQIRTAPNSLFILGHLFLLILFIGVNMVRPLITVKLLSKERPLVSLL